MRRRDFIIFLAGAMAAWPLAARAQQKAMPVIGVLAPGNGAPSKPLNPNSLMAAFYRGLREIGYIEGQNVFIEFRGAEGNFDRYPALAADLVERRVDLIVTVGGTPPVLAAKSATSTIPILFAGIGDPVASGIVASLARPGGNLTGVSNLIELMPKRLELVTELVPQAAIVTLFINPLNSTHDGLSTQVEEAARVKGRQTVILKVTNEVEIEAAFTSLARLHAGAVLISPDPLFFGLREKLAALATHNAMPTINYAREYVEAGGLVSYGPSIPALYQQTGNYAGRILKGEKPADLPVQQPTKFELVINLKTAKALGLTVPQSLLVRADEVIE